MQPHEWQLQSAKARFSELFELARTVGPQRVTRRGKDSVMVISTEEYERLSMRRRPTTTLYELIASSPLKGLDLDLERSQDVGRDVEL
ncbi:MAG: type II toxin-antitoxin system prevent-host-death family antitoxin [Thermaerobacter sp.]|nr:type II toxin-antitoxin system prevent-host-death family antitoxin [Thermaerobacter sp.]